MCIRDRPLFILGAVFFSLLTPLLPIVAIVAVIWLLLKASTRPRLI